MMFNNIINKKKQTLKKYNKQLNFLILFKVMKKMFNYMLKYVMYVMKNTHYYQIQ